TDALDVLYAFAAPQPQPMQELLFAPFAGRNEPDELADRFLGGVPEHALGASIPRCKKSIHGGCDDSVIRRFQGCNMDSLAFLRARSLGDSPMQGRRLFRVSTRPCGRRRVRAYRPRLSLLPAASPLLRR